MAVGLIIGAAIAATAQIAGGITSRNAQRQAAKQARAAREMEADAQAARLKANAKRQLMDRDTMRVQKSIEMQERRRTNRILQSRRANAAAGAGSTVAGTSLERFLVQQEGHDALGEDILNWQWDARLANQADQASLTNWQADQTKATGYAVAETAYNVGMIQADASLASGIFGAMGTVGSAMMMGAAGGGSGSGSPMTGAQRMNMRTSWQASGISGR